MVILMRRAFSSTLLLACLITTPLPAEETSAQELRWFKGNTHTHTLNSDGDSTPDEVVRWYRENGYHFLVLTDHNFLTDVDALDKLHGAKERFLVIPGEEVSDVFDKRPIHVNGLDVRETVEPQGGASVADTLQRNVDAIRKAEGIPHINHPNYQWAISADDLAMVHNYRLFEIFNGHPYVNNVGNVDSPGLEEVWDRLLSRGKVVYGIAVDDAHHFKRPWSRDAAKPGQGWIVVRARELSASAILSAMEAGEFYASTGPSIDRYDATAETISITIADWPGAKFTTQFIGDGGRILAETASNPAVYHFDGGETYVRARVTDSNGSVAWTQPVFPSHD